MSELLSCNYCALEDIRRFAEQQDEPVTLNRLPSGGVDVLVAGVFIAWFAVLPKGCRCNGPEKERY